MTDWGVLVSLACIMRGHQWSPWRRFEGWETRTCCRCDLPCWRKA